MSREKQASQLDQIHEQYIKQYMPVDVESYSLSQIVAFCNQWSKLLARFVLKMPDSCFNTCVHMNAPLLDCYNNYALINLVLCYHMPVLKC